MSAFSMRASSRPAPTATAPQRPVKTALRGLPRAGSSNGGGQMALLELLNHVAAGTVPPTDAAQRLEAMNAPGASPASTSRPEVIFAAGKTAEQLVADLQRVAQTQGVVLATRVDLEVAAQVEQLLPDVQIKEKARMLVYRSPTVQLEKLPGAVAIIAAGSANEPVVEECRTMLQSLGCYCFTLGQAGVMGMHRMVQNIEAVRAADVCIIVTGADGAMVSLAGGMVDTPVIALPTSSGYGAALNGVAPLLSSLNSAAPGVTVVNIDSGVGASMAAWRILKNAAKLRKAAAGQH